MLDSLFLINTPCGLCGRRATLNSNFSPSSVNLILLFRSAFDLPCWTGWLPWRSGQFAAGTPLPPPPCPPLTTLPPAPPPPPPHTHTPTPQLLPQVQRLGPGLTGRRSSKLGFTEGRVQEAVPVRHVHSAVQEIGSIQFHLSSQQKHLFFCQASQIIFVFFVQIVTAQPSNQ